MKKITILTIIAVFLLLISGIGWYAWPKNKEPKLIRTVDRGIDQENRARLEAVISEITEKIGNDREMKDLNLWIDLGNYKNTLGDLEGAAESYRIGTELNVLNHVSWANLASVRAEMNDLAGADTAYRKALDLVDLPAYYEKYAAFLEQYFPEKKQSYENLLLTAVQTVGQQPEFIGRLAAFYEKEGRLLEAKSHLELLIQLNPENSAVRNDLERVEAEIAEQRR